MQEISASIKIQRLDFYRVEEKVAAPREEEASSKPILKLQRNRQIVKEIDQTPKWWDRLEPTG